MARTSLALAAVLLFVAPGLSGLHAAEAVDFNRDVRPILSAKCFKCHGPDESQRKAGLRLDHAEGATVELESGERAVVPRQPEASELIRRILSDDPSEQMPPPASNKVLAARDKEILQQWVRTGAVYQQHWAFVPPQQPAPPAAVIKDWVRNEIDQFLLAKMTAAGLTPSPEADRLTLVRRLSLDLIGLPPTPEEADAFVQDTAPDAYERLVERLLASPQYGERWARRWLDLARYADTNGYEKDRVRSIWPYRDWVIKALNDDLPFDQFTIEQIAGDMLPEATQSQRIATGFHRNTMLNEEGGIDPLEFRFHAMTDRVATTGTVWLGLTVGCAQCHTHKFDPITHQEYYQFLALLNNMDEPELDVVDPQIAARRAEIEQKITALEADLPNQFPPAGETKWEVVPLTGLTSTGGATAKVLDDGSLLVEGANPERDTYTVTIDSKLTDITSIRLEALADDALPKRGPGRTPHGNFVLNEIQVSVVPLPEPGAEPAKPQPARLVRAEADFSQASFSANGAIDGNPQTGWAIHGPEPWNVNRTLQATLDKPTGFAQGTRWTFTLVQQFGDSHTLGRFRLSLGKTLDDGRPLAERQLAHRDQKFQAWLAETAPTAVRWRPLTPATAHSEIPRLEILGDGTVFASGDQSKRDIYELTFRPDGAPITAIRLETIPDDRLPRRGSGRIYYEGPFGDFFLSTITLTTGTQPRPFNAASGSFAAGASTADRAIDTDPQSGWSINGGQNRIQAAVFTLEKPLAGDEAFELALLFEKYYAAGLGRFRIWATSDPQRPIARTLAPDVEAALRNAVDQQMPLDQLAPEIREPLMQAFVQVAPELTAAREAITQLRTQLPAFPTTLVMAERPQENPRKTFLHRRGEYLQPGEQVQADLLSILPGLPAEAAPNRLNFARWLASPENPLVARVTVNRHWAALFGRGLVRTTEDFGYQGEPPTHPELLDWLAVEFMNRGWSVKELHRLMVTSAAYRQSSRITPEAAERDPENLLLARAPRFRLEAELIRDAALRMSGLLSTKMGGPSVFPPQPPGVTSEGTYGPLVWNVSTGEDRYRRGLYTFTKRTAPYAMFLMFDAPSGEACVPRREISNTPLQALTLLNDTVFLEAAQALGKQTAAQPGTMPERLNHLSRRCLIRPPAAEEQELLAAFYGAQRERLAAGQLDPVAIAGPGEGDPLERAAWTLVARALLNLDETMMRD